MNCEEARTHWGLYHDSEGDPELFLRVNAHLGECPACAESFHRESRLEDLLAERLSGGEATPELWARVLARAGVAAPRTAPVRRWLVLASSLALAACLLVSVVIWQGHRRATSLSRLSADVHERIVSNAAVLDFESASDLEVERYLRQRVTFPVRCPPRNDSGFAVAGAGATRLAHEDAAYVFGHVDGRPVSLVILARESLARFPHQQSAVRREGTHRCREGRYAMVMREIDRNVVVVVGETGTEQLERVLRAYGTYHEPHHG
jgi:anti-sigma factor RsiW